LPKLFSRSSNDSGQLPLGKNFVKGESSEASERACKSFAHSQ
jgi:hypothetical protein